MSAVALASVTSSGTHSPGVATAAAGGSGGAGVAALGVGSPSLAAHAHRLTLVLPSVIEDSGDGGVSRMYLPATTANHVRDCVEASDEESAGEEGGGHSLAMPASASRTQFRRPPQPEPSATASGPVEAVGTTASPITRVPSTSRRYGRQRSGLSKPTLSPTMIRFTPPSQYVPVSNIAVCMAPGCRTAFNLFHRRYRCPMCGRIFCFTCCASEICTATTTSAGGDANPAPFPPAESPQRVAPHGGAYDPAGEAPAEAGAGLPPSPDPASGSCRVCRQCYYEAQLVLSKRQPNGELRRRCRGEFKLFQRSLLLNILSFLTLRDLAEVSRVSSDFYFIARDNFIWYQHNMQRWIKEAESPRLNTMAHSSTMSWQVRPTPSAFEVAPVLQDATSSANNEAARRVISLHARYNYTQFLDYARRLEMAQRDGLSSFMLGTRILFSAPIRIAVIGPSHIGKTAAIRSFMGEDAGRMVVLPTMGLTRYAKTVRLRGAVKTEVILHIYDLSGAARYEQLRRFICRNAHAVGLCYDPTKKVTLVEAADIMMAVEDSLGPQPVVVCGLVPPNLVGGSAATSPGASATSRLPPQLSVHAPGGGSALRSHTGGSASPAGDSLGGASAEAVATPSLAAQLEVMPADAKGITVRGRRSLHCPLLDAAAFFQELLQCLLDRIALATMEKAETGAAAAGAGPNAGLLAEGPTSVGASLSDLSGAGVLGASGSPTAASSPRTLKRPKADQAVARALLNMTMQACPLDILLDA